MYSDTVSLSRYLQDPHKTKCKNGSGDGFAFKSSVDSLPSAIENKIRAGASVSGHTLFSSNHISQDVFDERRIEAKSSVNYRSLSSARSGLDLKADADYWDSTYMTKPDAHANVSSNSESTGAVAYLRNLYSGHFVNVNDHLDERKYDQTYTSELAKRCGYEGRELSRLYGYEGRESCSFGDESFATSTGCRSLNSDFVAMIDAQVTKDAPKLGESGILKSNASTSLFSSHVHNGHISSQILGMGQDVSPADLSLTDHGLRTGQEVSPANLSLLTTNSRNYYVEKDEALAMLPLEHDYTPNSKILKTDTVKQKGTLLSIANCSAGRKEERSKELSHRSSQRGRSWRLISRPLIQPKRVVKVQGSDVGGHIRIDDKACRKQSSPSRANRRLSPEDKRKHKRSVWSRISGLGRSRNSQIFREDLTVEGLDLSFPVNCKDVRCSSDVLDHNKLDVVEELNVDFTFSENTFLVDFKRRKSKLPSNEIDSKDGKGLANGRSCLTGAGNMSENQKQKRRKLLRSEISHQGL
ncbi:hypothetical protein O6H91_17G074800 [Diphasiastrum complanatum]|nr:hypothetical protein O6H91_17G074800 [Diphasiastrum complanatum]